MPTLPYYDSVVAFSLVRLIDGQRTKQQVDCYISIPSGAIKSFTAIITADARSLFQFLLVRLKVGEDFDVFYRK